MSNSPWSDLDRPPLRVAALRRALVHPPWTAVEVVASTGSTNADLAEAARAGAAAPGAVLVADHQQQGRGRRERTWTAPPRSSLAVSVLLAPGEGANPVPPTRWSWLPLLTGLAVVDALVRTCGLDAQLKWPNDVLVEAAAGAPASRGWHKVCGVLAEVVSTPSGQAVVVGIGLNVSQREDELPDGGPGGVAGGSLATLGSATTDRDTVLRSVLRSLGARYEAWVGAGGDPRASEVGAAYREASATIGESVAVHLPGDQTLTGVAEGVDDAGCLLLRPHDGTAVRALAAGDVVHVRPGTA
ncbi:MAG TPA: biotin--[acetyl-CoA-carboxylase] ligase [Actinomycetales bacterium]|nr:biotin--[acetyl-CoA-carboxylase] ligase [Actinomycetales bacterium]